MRNASHVIILLVATLLLSTSCIDRGADYGLRPGDNLVLAADTMQLLATPEGMSLTLDYAPDSAVIRRAQDFVITEVFRVPQSDTAVVDTVWLRVGSDGIPLGWVSQQVLLSNAAPVDPISLLIFQTRRHHVAILVGLAILVLLAVFNIKRSTINVQHTHYPIALILSLAAAGVAYSALATLAPHLWQQFYLHPTLNPLGQPGLLALFLSFVWLSIVLWLATAFDLHSRQPLGKVVAPILTCTALGLLLYALFANSSLVYINIAAYIAIVCVIIYKSAISKADKSADKQK